MLDQHDLYKNVFLLIDDEGINSKYFISVLADYVRSLNYFKLNVEHYIHKLFIEHLISSRRYYQLHQLLQYHVIGDNVHVACQLLAMEKYYPPAYQLALDMLKRLSTQKGVNDQIVEIFLSRGLLVQALRFLRNNPSTSAMPERFLELALDRDEHMFYTVYKFFKNGGMINKKCAPYIQAFCKMFPDAESSNTTTPDDLSDESGPSSSASSFNSFQDLLPSPPATSPLHKF